MSKRLTKLLFTSATAVLLIATNLVGKTLIFPPAALPDLVKLGPARIETRWKPRSIPDGYFPIVEGYYVVYNHENLALFFGPVDTEPEAVKIQTELEETRRFLISKNSALSSSTVGRINIDFGGTPPTNQAPIPSEGLKPVRILSGNSTLELGRESENSESTSGSTTEGSKSSDFGIGSGTAETGEPSQSPPNNLGSESETKGSSGSQEQASGNSVEGEGQPSGNPLGQGILNVLSQGKPTGSENGVEPPDGSDGPESQSGSAAGSPDLPQTTEGNSTDSAQQGDGGSGKPSGAEGGESTAPPGGSGTAGVAPQIPQIPGAQEQLESTGTAAAPGSSTSPQNLPGETGTESGNPAGQSPPAPPKGLSPPSAPPGLPESETIEKGNEAHQSIEAGTPSTGQEASDQPTSSQTSEATSEEANEQLNSAEESLDSTAAETGEPSESTATEDTSSAGQSEESSSEKSSSKEEKAEPAQPESNSPETQTTEKEEETNEESAEQAEDPESETVPPTPTILELGESIQQSTSPASSIRINQLLKRKLGQPVPPVPTAEPEK